MKTIWFKSDTIIPDPEFVDDCNKMEIAVMYGLWAETAGDVLIVTDKPEIYRENKECLAVIYSEEDTKLFPGAKYFVMEPQDNEPDYFVRIWQRLKGLPWTVSETERLIIRETVEDDLDELVEMYKDPSMTVYTEPLYETEAERRYITQYREQVYEIQGFGIWSLLRKEDGKLIGRAGLVSRNDYEGVEIGFALGEKYRGQGYATEAVRECLRLAELMDFDRVRALIMPGNTDSVKLVKKLNFKFHGEICHKDEKYEMWEIILR